MLPVSSNVDVAAFSQTRYLMNSYELYWFASILEELKSRNRKISFKRVVTRMITKSWNSHLKNKLHLECYKEKFVYLPLKIVN